MRLGGRSLDPQRFRERVAVADEIFRTVSEGESSGFLI
jgi:hypothetical protein